MSLKRIGWVLFFLVSHVNANAQLSLNDLLELVETQNLELLAANARVEQRVVQSTVGAPIAPMQLKFDYGNIQNIGTGDYAIGIDQTFTNPGKSKSLKSFYNSKINEQQSLSKIVKIGLYKTVRDLFYEMAYLEGKRLILDNQLLLFQDLEKYSEARIIAGETSILEKLSITSKLLQLENAKFQVSYEYTEKLEQIQGIINTEDTLVFTFSKGKALPPAELYSNPNLQYLEELKKSAVLNTELNKSLLKPDFSLGIYNQSMGGSYSQFYFSAGIGIPIFSKAEKSKITLSQINEKIIALEIGAEERRMASKMKSLHTKQQGILKSIENYQTKLLPEAKKFIETAKIRFQEGELSFSEFYVSQLMHVNFLNELEDAWLNYHLTISELAYMTGE